MARVESWFDQDLKQAVKVRHLNGVVFDDDNNGNLIGVRIFSDGTPVQLSESCVGYCILANGDTVPVSGTVNQNWASILLPEAAYSIPGPINIIIKLISGTTATTVAAVTSTVISLGSVVDISQSTINSWSAQISATLAALEDGAVLYSEAQSLSDAQKAQARGNIGANATAVLISGEDYKIVYP